MRHNLCQNEHAQRNILSYKIFDMKVSVKIVRKFLYFKFLKWIFKTFNVFNILFDSIKFKVTVFTGVLVPKNFVKVFSWAAQPGLTAKFIHHVALKVENFQQICWMSLKPTVPLIWSKIWKYFFCKLKPNDTFWPQISSVRFLE